MKEYSTWERNRIIKDINRYIYVFLIITCIYLFCIASNTKSARPPLQATVRKPSGRYSHNRLQKDFLRKPSAPRSRRACLTRGPRALAAQCFLDDCAKGFRKACQRMSGGFLNPYTNRNEGLQYLVNKQNEQNKNQQLLEHLCVTSRTNSARPTGQPFAILREAVRTTVYRKTS